MSPIAPDADRNNDRTIVLFYCMNQQGHSVQKVTRTRSSELREQICFVRDGRNFDSEIKTLCSWGVMIEEVIPNIPTPRDRKYWIHDTPRVRKILEHIDELAPEERALRIRDQVKSNPSTSAYVMAALVQVANGDCEWLEIRDVCARRRDDR